MNQYISLKNIKKKCELNFGDKNIKVEEIYVPKLICISSFIPYPMQFRTILEKLVIYVQKNKIKIPIEKEIENLIFGIPFPKKCAFYPIKRSDYYVDNTIDFLLRDLNQNNFYSYKMKSLFTFKMDDIFEIYSKYIYVYFWKSPYYFSAKTKKN